MITTYLFDLDDTLIDTRIYGEVYKPIREKIKKKLHLDDTELDKKAESIGLKKHWHGRFDTGDLCRKLGLLDLYYDELENAIKVIPSLNDYVEYVLKNLKERGKKIGIVSNSMRRTISLYLKEYNLEGYIDFVFSQDDAGYEKSDIKYWQKLVEKERIIPENCLVAGDSLEEDIGIPKRLGFKTYYINRYHDLRTVLDI